MGLKEMGAHDFYEKR